MSRRVVESRTCDLDPSQDAVETLSLVINGRAYEVDLSQPYSDQFHAQVAPYLEAGRKVTAGAGKARKGASGGANDAPAIRAWAAQQGIAVPARGRIPAEVRAAYAAGH